MANTEILVHVSAPSGTRDDARYCAQVEAILGFQPITRYHVTASPGENDAEVASSSDREVISISSSQFSSRQLGEEIHSGDELRSILSTHSIPEDEVHGEIQIQAKDEAHAMSLVLSNGSSSSRSTGPTYYSLEESRAKDLNQPGNVSVKKTNGTSRRTDEASSMASISLCAAAPASILIPDTSSSASSTYSSSKQAPSQGQQKRLSSYNDSFGTPISVIPDSQPEPPPIDSQRPGELKRRRVHSPSPSPGSRDKRARIPSSVSDAEEQAHEPRPLPEKFAEAAAEENEHASNGNPVLSSSKTTVIQSMTAPTENREETDRDTLSNTSDITKQNESPKPGLLKKQLNISTTLKRQENDNKKKKKNKNNKKNNDLVPDIVANRSGAAKSDPTPPHIPLSDLPLQILPPPPPISSDPFITHVTPTLEMLAKRLRPSRTCKPVSQTRDLEKLERGYWLVRINVSDASEPHETEARKLPSKSLLLHHHHHHHHNDRSMAGNSSSSTRRESPIRQNSNNINWTFTFFSRFWSFLTEFISRDGRAGWGVWCFLEDASSPSSSSRVNEPRTSETEEEASRFMPNNIKYLALKVYAWGEIASHIYLLLFLASERRIRNMGAQWRDSREQVVIQMP